MSHYIRVVLLFCILLVLANSQKIRVYQIIAQKENEKVIGSTNMHVNMEAQLFSNNFQRKLVILNLSQFNNETFKQIIAKKGAGILLIMELENDWKQFYNVLLDNVIEIPVYLVNQSDELTATIQKLDQQSQQFIQFIIQNKESKIIDKDLILEDFYGLLHDFEEHKNLPIIMLTASYDMITPSPELNIGANSFIQGAQILLKMMEYLQSLRKINKLDTQYNVLFYLTSSKNKNYENLFDFIQNPTADTLQMISKVEYLIHIDSFSEGSVKVTKNSNSDYGIEFQPNDQLLSILKKTALQYKMAIEIPNDKDIAINKKIKTVVIQDNNYPDLTEKYRDSIHNLHFIQEVMLKMLIKLKNEKKLVKAEEEQNMFQQEVDYLLNENLRYPTYIQKGCYLNNQIMRIFENLSFNAKRIQNRIKNTRFFSSQKVYLNISQSLSPFLDLYLFGGICCWISLIYLLFKKKDEEFNKKRQ